jgi:glycosyltransferase involved in cell wall biosynthesis
VELCRVLDRVLPEAKFFVYSNVPISLPVENGRWFLRGDEGFFGRRLSPFAWYQLCAGQRAAKDGVSVFWGGANFLPLGLPNRIRAVVTVLDVVQRMFPQSMGYKHRQAFKLFFRAGLRRANIVTAISEGTSARLGHFGYRTADIVVRPSVSQQFRPPSASAVIAMRERLGIRGAYLLSISTLEPRKNLDSLVEAFVAMRRAGELAGVALLLVGQSGWKNERLQAQLAEAQAAGAEIILPGYVPDELLPALYAGAEAVVMPSIYEGFGLPVLEARACGARVVATDIPEIREAGGAFVTYIDPTVTGIQEGIFRALAQPRPEPESAADYSSWGLEGRKLAQAMIVDRGLD